ncbi:Na(+)-translocating NADH-quinone reductase subunit A [Aureibacter tunicatorum]|uniref:Na(+)-translocating NADH-quinone reductase subunit A n=1 Tax=Aureibacter tunicatorum TaxID=866807 RepID=A0AAE3XLP2_9BACT|nr:Na(+)-translocating NADH-quinone reductase subunit A [Aureibacter tunicatorum]MDR6240216.1 Na+-transporting NADH:ubiquinone oxidoreductase subunit A [Aureibacter tunicatorum]BDD05903.1 Na(+)-translocating NADH-quinone reductase subunit A [Aureibacter tunicatorum]
MSKTIKLKRGFDIRLKGVAEQKVASVAQPEVFALKPLDFVGIQRPKVTVKEGETVKAGTPILFDKKNEQVLYTAPVSGEVVEIKRGLKRRVEEIKILADKEIQYETFNAYSSSELGKASREQLQEQLLKSGAWPHIIQRPYGVVAKPSDTARDIFISGFDSNPLAADIDFILKDDKKYLQAGIDVISKFTSGKVYLGLNGKKASQLFSDVSGVEKYSFQGPHPAGNVGVQIHNVKPVNKDEVVWTISPYGLVQIGKVFLEGKYDASKVVAVAGSEVKTAQYYKTYSGACIKNFLKDNLLEEHVRCVSGSPLTGSRIEKDGFIGFYDNSVAVIPEGDEYELFGWALPTTNKLSFHKALGLLSFVNPHKEFRLNTNIRGEERAFVQSGVLERVVPMDVLPTYLLKAVMAQDFENMEALGIYEVIEEDLALCEFVDVSKHKVQAILREGLDLLQYS